MKYQSAAYAAMMIITISLAGFGCTPKNPTGQTNEISSSGSAVSGTGSSISERGAKPDASSASGTAAGSASAATAAAGFEDKIYFAFDQYEISSDSIKTLTGLVSFLKENATLKVQIMGNCDERGTSEYNMALGDRRAKAAKEYCIAQGIDAERISTVSYGEEKPADSGNNEEAWAKNRRDEFVFSK